MSSPAVPGPGRAQDRRPSSALLAAAILVLAFNLRVSVNALGALLPRIRGDLDLSGTSAGVLNSLPSFVFAFAGIATPAIAARMGSARLVVLSLLTSLAGQVLRASSDTTTALFAGTLLSLVGLALANVLVPGLVRDHFPTRITSMTAGYVSVLSVGATIGSAVTIPFINAVGGSWRSGLLLWATITAAAVLPWVLVARAVGAERQDERQAVVPLRTLAGSPLAWAMAGFFALQSAQVYVALGWFGQVLLDAGVNEVSMGAQLALLPALGIAQSLLVPPLMRHQQRIPLLVGGFGAAYVVGYLGLVTVPSQAPWVWMFFVGLGGGTFPAVLTLVALRAASGQGVIALSAFTQCIGYLMASTAPLVFGLLHDLTGSWRPSLLMMTASLAPMVVVGLRLARPQLLEDQLARRRD